MALGGVAKRRWVRGFGGDSADHVRSDDDRCWGCLRTALGARGGCRDTNSRRCWKLEKMVMFCVQCVLSVERLVLLRKGGGLQEKKGREGRLAQL